MIAIIECDVCVNMCKYFKHCGLESLDDVQQFSKHHLAAV